MIYHGPLIVEGRGSPWGIAIISNKQDRGSDPNDPANALQRAIFKAGADTSVGIGFDPKLPDNTLSSPLTKSGFIDSV